MTGRDRERGSAFIVALGVLVALVLAMVSVAAQQRTNFMSRLNEVESRNARLAAESGIQRGIAELSAQFVGDQTSSGSTTTQQAGAVTLNDQWAVLGNTGNEKFTMGNDSFRIQMVDNSSFININSAPETQLERLPLTTEQIEAWLDFRESGTSPRTQGAKDEYYNALTNPYNARLAPFRTVDELLNVRGITASTLFQPATETSSSGTMIQSADGSPVVLYDYLIAYSKSANNNPDGSQRVNVNAQGTSVNTLMQAPISLNPQLATQIAARKNWSSIGEVASLASDVTARKTILDYLSTSGSATLSGRINVNTASEAVLKSIAELPDDVAESILQRQSQGFAGLGDLAEIPGFSGSTLTAAADRLTTSSTTFTIRVIGTSGRVSVPLEATVEILDGRIHVVSLSTPPYADPAARWGWNADTTSEQVISNS